MQEGNKVSKKGKKEEETRGRVKGGRQRESRREEGLKVKEKNKR